MIHVREQAVRAQALVDALKRLTPEQQKEKCWLKADVGKIHISTVALLRAIS